MANSGYLSGWNNRDLPQYGVRSEFERFERERWEARERAARESSRQSQVECPCCFRPLRGGEWTTLGENFGRQMLQANFCNGCAQGLMRMQDREARILIQIYVLWANRAFI